MVGTLVAAGCAVHLVIQTVIGALKTAMEPDEEEVAKWQEHANPGRPCASRPMPCG